MNELPRSMAQVVPRLVQLRSAARDTDAVLRVLLDGVVVATGVDAGAVYRWDGAQALLIRVATTAGAPDFAGTVRLGDGPIGGAAEARAPRVLAGPLAGASPEDVAARRGLRSLVSVPLVHADRLAGAIVVGRRMDDSAVDADLGVLDTLASLAGPILVLAEADGQAAAARRRFEALTHAARELAHDLNNDLTMPIGALELMRERADLPADVQELIAAAAEDLTRVEARVRAFQQVARGEW